MRGTVPTPRDGRACRLRRLPSAGAATPQLPPLLFAPGHCALYVRLIVAPPRARRIGAPQDDSATKRPPSLLGHRSTSIHRYRELRDGLRPDFLAKVQLAPGPWRLREPPCSIQEHCEPDPSVPLTALYAQHVLLCGLTLHPTGRSRLYATVGLVS